MTIYNNSAKVAFVTPKDWQVPSYNVSEISPRASDYCVIIPVINEGNKVLTQLEGMRDAQLGVDVILADGGSTDGSTEPEGLAARGVRTLLVKTGPGKLSAQLRMGFAYALSQGYKGVIIIDGNGKDEFDAIPRFVEALRAGYGFVQGSRYASGGKAVNTPLDRHLAVMLVHAPIVSLASKFRYTDTTNGFRALSSEFLLDPRVAPFRDIFDTYNLHYYLAIRAARLGYRVKEIGVTRIYPAKGKTPTKISGMHGRLHILRQLFTAATGGYNPPGDGV